VEIKIPQMILHQEQIKKNLYANKRDMKKYLKLVSREKKRSSVSHSKKYYIMKLDRKYSETYLLETYHRLAMKISKQMDLVLL
jgi:hypothetical protein